MAAAENVVSKLDVESETYRSVMEESSQNKVW